MSSAVVSTSAALGRPFLFDDVSAPHVGTAALGCPVERSSTARRDHLLQSTINKQKILPSSITPASRLDIRPQPQIVSSGIPALDSLTGGLPRGCLTEICGPASSGRTTVLLAALAAATNRGEFCAVIDAGDVFDPRSAAAASVELERLLWVRCGDNPPKRSQQNSQSAFDFDRTISRQSERRLEQVLRATDLLLESGGFGLIVLDLADLPPQAARRIPLTTWFRFRRAVENKSTILLAIEQHAIAGSCSSLLLQLGAAKRRKNAAHSASCGLHVQDDAAPEGRKQICLTAQSVIDPKFANPAHVRLLIGLEITAELIRSRLDRKPARSVMFATKTAWAG